MSIKAENLEEQWLWVYFHNMRLILRVKKQVLSLWHDVEILVLELATRCQVDDGQAQALVLYQTSPWCYDNTIVVCPTFLVTNSWYMTPLNSYKLTQDQQTAF